MIIKQAFILVDRNFFRSKTKPVPLGVYHSQARRRRWLIIEEAKEIEKIEGEIHKMMFQKREFHQDYVDKIF